jgi:HEAT repeat protein
MTVTTSQLRSHLDRDEPDYPALARLGPAILPQLEQLAGDRSTYVAANAASLAGIIGGDRAIGILAGAARNKSPLVRTAAAAAITRIQGPKAASTIAILLNDRDKGVRKFAIKAAATRPNAALASKVAELSKRDPQPHLRSLASQALSRTRRA